MVKQFFHNIFLTVLLLTCSVIGGEVPQRVISMAPNITEIIFKIGVGDMLVGRTEFCVYPPQARNVSSIGGYLNPDYEKIVALQPDIIIMLPNLEMERKLQNLGLRTFTLPDETVEQILHSIKTIGRLLNHEQQAQALVQGIRDTLSWVAEQTTVDDSISTLLIVGREANSLKGLYAAGEDTYLSEILQLCGGTNVFADIDSRYFDVSKEAVIQRNPKAIFELRIIDAHDQSNQVSKLKQDWQQLPILQAVKLNRIYLFTERYFQIPGPRISQIAVAFYQAMHQVNLD